MTRLRFNSLFLLIIFTSLLLFPLRSAAGQDLPDGVDTASPAAVEATAGVGFTYQGQLRRSGAPYTGTCAMQFRVFTNLVGGTQVGPTLTFSSVKVASGVFAATLNFGVGVFTGDTRWLATSVKCGAEASYTNLTPRQALAVTPYAVSLRPGAIMSDTMTGASLFVLKNAANSNAIHGKATASGSIGVWGEGVNNTGVYGLSQNGIGVWGKSNGTAAPQSTATAVPGSASAAAAAPTPLSMGNPVWWACKDG
ncbi:MAG: hypothetical protein IPK16_07030 [Anaerolineales bacterium]|nr:hypothetical protein [Anaerolineales bacterium]